MEDETLRRYERVRDAMTRADIPASSRNPQGTEAAPVAFTFDPIMKEMIDAINKEWTDMFFVSGESYSSMDDDKLPSTSPKFKAYGMKRTPTKDKKLKPVFHVACTIGSENICNITPDTTTLKLGDMLRNTIRSLCPDESLRPYIAFFIDRGYMELAKQQDVDVTNLIQIMREMGVKFLGTVKDSKSYPFYFVDVNEDGEVVKNDRVIAQMYGMRTNITAKQQASSRANDIIQASVLRHGFGKVRGARIVTNLPEAMENTWVYETRTNQIDREENVKPPLPLRQDATLADRIAHAYETMKSSLYIISRQQRRPDWFWGRLWRWTSTTFHATVNVTTAEYFNTNELRQLHQEVKDILQLNPRNAVTYHNSADLEEDDLPSQRSGIHARLPLQEARHNNCTAEFWERGRDKPTLKNLCDERNIAYPDPCRKNQLAQLLANYHQQQADALEAELVTLDVADNDVERNSRAGITLLRRMFPYWFTKPFNSSGARSKVLPMKIKW